MNNQTKRGRGVDPLLTGFVVLCASLIAVAGLSAAGTWLPVGWARLLTIPLALGTLGVGVVAFSSVLRRTRRSLDALRQETDRLGRQRFPELMKEAIDNRDAQLLRMRLPTVSDKSLKSVVDDIGKIGDTAVRLASDHDEIRTGYADVFVNTFRRTQTLLLRQLQIIEGLERSSSSPADLNRFYQLDHLVMRMRRNNENILVLSGTELMRKTRDPVPVKDLLRASISEIDSYQRVRLLSTPSIRVSNTAAGDLIRIVAELLDNATSFSPPDKQVTVKAELARHRGLSIGVIDNGIGMSDADIGKANEQLRRLGAAEIARSRRLGLLVVGRLAGRHGFRVELFGGDEVEGVSALISVPSSALLEEEEVRATLPGDLNRGSTMGPRAAANRAGRGESAVPMTVTVRRPEKPASEEAGARVRRPSPWHSRKRVGAVARRPTAPRELPDLVAQAHSDVSGELPTRVPQPGVGRPGTQESNPRTPSRWFQARSATKQARKDSAVLREGGAEVTQNAEDDWKSTVDSAWQKVVGVSRSDGYTYTEDGLPLRQKGAHLIPGSAQRGAGGAERKAKPIERDAKYTRRRLSSYQQGVQKAKEQEARMRGTTQSGGWTILEIDN
ncbi:ATP-binding protein [Amycolatopsis japonica]